MASAYVGEVIEGHVHRAHRVQRRVEVGLVAVSKKLATDRMSISEADPEARVRDRALGRDLETLASADVHPRRLVGVDRGDEAGRLKARHDGTLAGEVEDFILHDNRRVGLTAHDRVIVRLPCVRQLGIGSLEIHERNLEAGVRKEGERKDVHEKGRCSERSSKILISAFPRLPSFPLPGTSLSAFTRVSSAPLLFRIL